MGPSTSAVDAELLCQRVSAGTFTESACGPTSASGCGTVGPRRAGVSVLGHGSLSAHTAGRGMGTEH